MNIKALIKSWRAATNIVEWMGGAIFNGDVSVTGALSATGGISNSTRSTGPLVTVTYSAAPVIDASLGNFFVMTITNGTALVVDAGLGSNYFDKEIIRLAMRLESGAGSAAARK